MLLSNQVNLNFKTFSNGLYPCGNNAAATDHNIALSKNLEKTVPSAVIKQRAVPVKDRIFKTCFVVLGCSYDSKLKSIETRDFFGIRSGT
jgi:hypothetical protein